MARSTMPKKERQQALNDILRDDPFITDEELSEIFNVSIQTIRLDRLELGIRSFVNGFALSLRKTKISFEPSMPKR